MHFRSLLAALLVAAMGPVQAGPKSFAGVWAIEQCDVEAARQPCGGFTLVLVQQGDRLCGNHFAATPNFSRVDEGAPTSVIGTVLGKDAVLFVASGRDPTSYLARATLLKDGLAWRLVEQLNDGGLVGAPVIALNETLHRKNAEKKLAQAASACASHFKVLP